MSARHRARRTSPLYIPSAFDLFKPSRDLVLKHFGIFGWLFAFNLVFWVHCWIFTPAGSGHYWNRFVDANYSWSFPSAFAVAFIGFSILWFLIAVVGGVVVQIMLQRAQLEVAEGRTPQFAELKAFVKKKGWRLFGLYVSMFLIIGIGFVLLIIPGLIMLRRYILAPYVMIDKRCSIKEALDGSAALSRVNTGAAWGLIGVLALIGLIGIVPYFGSLASFIVGALYSVAPALRYQ